MRHLVWKTALMALLLLVAPSAALAQEDDNSMDFTMEDAEGEGDGDSSMDFTVDEAEATIPTEGITVTGLILRADSNVSLEALQAANDALLAELDKLVQYGYQNVPNFGLSDEFAAMGEQGAQDCLYNPICLNRLGREQGLQRMVIGRLGGSRGDFSISLDLINPEAGVVEKYVSRTVKGSRAELAETISSSVPRLFDVRVAGKGGSDTELPPAEPSQLQKAMAWSTLGVGVVSIGVGAFVGLSARGTESDVEDNANAGNITQVDAESQIQDAKDKALLANVFYGVGIAAGVTSALLFLITPGSDIATEEELAHERFEIKPLIGPDAAGVQAGFSW